MQIHHIDGNPSNNKIGNLAVLCLECHDQTQIVGGFHQKLSADLVTLYRDDWFRIVVGQRRSVKARGQQTGKSQALALRVATSEAEAYRENKQFSLLAAHYHHIGNKALRDKYVSKALRQEPSDAMIIFLRSMQGKSQQIPKETARREIARLTELKDWTQLARLCDEIGDRASAVKYYLLGVSEDLDQSKYFSAAFYLKELVKRGLIEELFKMALRNATKKQSLWWQVRALQELEWDSELRELVLKRERTIRASNDLPLMLLLAGAKGATDEYARLSEQLAMTTRWVNPNAVGFLKQSEKSTQRKPAQQTRHS